MCRREGGKEKMIPGFLKDDKGLVKPLFTFSYRKSQPPLESRGVNRLAAAFRVTLGKWAAAPIRLLFHDEHFYSSSKELFL